MIRPILAAGLAVLTCFPVQAHAQQFIERDRIEIPIVAMDANTFEAIENDGAGGTAMWCAAGLYTREVLGQRGGSIYIQQGRSASVAVPGRQGVVFSTQPVDGAFSSLSQGIRRTGKVFSMTHAYALCRETPRLRVEIVGR